MKRTLFVLAAGLVALVADVRPSAARQWYPWCAQYYDTSAITECNFMTYQQCRVTVSGIGGNCIQNVRPAPAGPPRDRRWQPFYPH